MSLARSGRVPGVVSMKVARNLASPRRPCPAEKSCHPYEMSTLVWGVDGLTASAQDQLVMRLLNRSAVLTGRCCGELGQLQEAVARPAFVRPRVSRGQHLLQPWRLVIDPETVLDRVRTNLERLHSVHTRGMAARYVERWRALVDGDLDGVLDALTSPRPYAVELRQNSPFAGVLSEDDRQACLSSFRSHWRLDHTA